MTHSTNTGTKYEIHQIFAISLLVLKLPAHIEQVVQHYVNIMNNGFQGEIYNVGTGVPMKTKVLLKILNMCENANEVLSGNLKEKQTEIDFLEQKVVKLQ